MSLKQQIIAEINSHGSMGVDRYIELCNTHYYSTRDPFGKAGDFTTAPEISQVFGEMIGIWAITAWERMGRPKDCAVVEFGPGRGTLMKDFLRAIKVAPEFKPEVHFVEMSPLLMTQQKENVPQATWHMRFPVLGKPTIVIANEFFDALPVKQFIGQTERRIVVEGGNLAFNMQAEPGAVREISPVGSEIMKEITTHAEAGLVIDYGYFEPEGIDTLQALKGHKYQHVLAEPGEADLTTLVNFAALAEASGREVKLTTQRDFLLSLGADVRARILGKEADVERLVAPEQMGELFKVLTF